MEKLVLTLHCLIHPKAVKKLQKILQKYFNGAKVCPNKNTDGCDSFFYSLKFASKNGLHNFNYPKLILPDNTIIGIKQNPACIRTAADCKQNSAGECIKDEMVIISQILLHIQTVQLCILMLTEQSFLTSLAEMPTF